MVTKNHPRKSPRARRKYKRTPGYVTVSSIADLGCNFTAEEKTRLNKQLGLTNRRSFKNIKGSFAPVWPPELEAGLLQGLCNHAVLHGRYEHIGIVKKNLYRNGFISRFIYKTTSKVRTPKQIGSRLQQLRGSTKNDDVLDLIDSRQVSTAQIQRVLALTCTPHTAPAPPSQLTTGVVSHGSNRRIFITVESDSAHHPSLPSEIMLLSPPKTIRLRMPAECQPYADVMFGMESTVVLLSPRALALHSTLKLFKGKMMCSTSVTSLVPDGIQSGQFRYAASFPPDIWQELYQHDDRTKRSIVHSVSCADEGTAYGTTQTYPLIEIHYKFISSFAAGSTGSSRKNTASSDLAHFVSRASPDDTFYSSAGTFKKGNAASVVCGSTPLKAEVFSPAGMFRRRYFTSVVHRAPLNFDAPEFWEKSGLLYSDAGEQQANCAWFESRSATTIHDLDPNHDDNFDQPNICQPSRHAAYSMTGEFMGYYPIHDY
ncbi:hypothetical protein C8R47DRAFT_62663 [Mycena vitilis]|nr:hypothetical protein C8R47DRAFT_62663 [Mycena vitilis]